MNHCGHWTGNMNDSDFICCFCGEKQVSHTTTTIPAGHGKFIPEKTVNETLVWKTGFCKDAR